MALYLPSADGVVNIWDAHKYNPRRKYKGIGAIIMIQQPGTKPMTDSGKWSEAIDPGFGVDHSILD